MPYEVEPVAFPFEFRGDYVIHLHRGDTEGYEGRRDMDGTVLGLE